LLISAANGFVSVEPLLEDLGKMNLKGIHWVIVGGESGPKARQMKPESGRPQKPGQAQGPAPTN
jgi:protein gp37